MNPSNLYDMITDSEAFCPGISLDCVILGFHEGSLKVLLNKLNMFEKWMLPGGFIYRDEHVDDAAARTLKSRTGLTDVYLRQFYFFGDPKRTKMDENEELMRLQQMESISEEFVRWFMQRFFSIGYYAFVEYEYVRIQNHKDEETAWFNLADIPPLYTDHNLIIEKAIDTIRGQMDNIPIGDKLLPKKFTLSELRIIYETILGEKLDRRNFQRKILSSPHIQKLNEVQKKHGQKPATLYSFKN